MRAWVAIGSNLGDRVAACAGAAAGLEAIPGTRLLRRSSLYLTEPVGIAGCEWFLNAVVELDTDLTPEALLERLLGIERRHGREREGAVGPRTLDLDLLDAEGELRADARLTLPHPRMHLRRFQLLPLAEISPGWRHPRLGRTAADLLGALPEGERLVRIARLEPAPRNGAAP